MALPKFRNTPLKPDSRGNYFRNLEQQKFTLGKDLVEAAKRRLWIEEIYLQNCMTTRGNCWCDSYLNIAKQIAGHGRAVVETFEQPDSIPASFGPPDFSFVNRLREAGVPVDVKGQGKFAGILPQSTTAENKPLTIRLHSALDEYKKVRLREYPGIYQGKQRVKKEINALYENLENCWLHDLDYAKCKAFINHWRKRPKTKRGEPASREWCESQITEFKNAVRELGRMFSDEYTCPKELDSIKCRVIRLPSDSNGNEINQKFLLVEEAALAFSNASQPLTRLILALGINCCSGPAELGRMTIQDFRFDEPHPFSSTIKFDGKHSFMRNTRRKTFTHHEALLWPWVVELVKEQISVCKANAWKYLFTDGGKPLYRCNEVYEDVGLPLPNTSKPESRFTGRWEKTKSEKSVGKIRKTFSNYLRQVNSSDVATLALAHKTDEDSMLKHYSNKPFARLFQATVDAQDYWDLPRLIKGS